MKASNAPAARVTAEQNEAASLIARLLPFIRERRMESGDRLPSERLLAERFGATRAIVREALALLEAMRVVERRPRSGVYLTAESRVGSLDAIVMRANLGLTLDESEANSLNEFRSILEAQAVELACVRRTPEDIARMDECMERCRAQFKRNESIGQASADFHLAIMAATHNQFLLRAAHSFYLATRDWREVLFTDRKVCVSSIREHQAIRDAIAQGNITRGRSVIKAHFIVADGYWRDFLVPAAPKAGKVESVKHRRRRGPTSR